MIQYHNYCIHDYVNVIKLVICIFNILIIILMITLELKEEKHKNMHFYLRH